MYFTAIYPTLERLGYLQRTFGGSTREPAFGPRGFGGLFAGPCACCHLPTAVCGPPFSAPGPNGLSSPVLASLVPLKAAGKGNFVALSRPRRLRFMGAGSKTTRFRACACNWNRSPVSFWRAPFGVCGLLATPNIHQIFGDNPAKFPRWFACRGVGFLLLRAVCSGNGFRR